MTRRYGSNVLWTLKIIILVVSMDSVPINLLKILFEIRDVCSGENFAYRINKFG